MVKLIVFLLLLLLALTLFLIEAIIDARDLPKGWRETPRDVAKREKAETKARRAFWMGYRGKGNENDV